MSKPKGAETSGITIYLPAKELADLDAHLAAAVAGIPGARLTRSAWAQQVVLAHLQQVAPRTEPSAAPATTKAKRK